MPSSVCDILMSNDVMRDYIVSLWMFFTTYSVWALFRWITE